MGMSPTARQTFPLQENDTGVTLRRAFYGIISEGGTPGWRMVMKTICVLLFTLLWLGCGGYSSPKAAAPQPGVMPAIAELSPDNASSGGPGFMLTVNGSNFNQDAVVKMNGTQQTTTFMTSNQLVAAIPASAIATPGTVPVTVTNPGHAAGGIYGSGGTAAATSTPMNFTIN
jgi:hypothetical protein